MSLRSQLAVYALQFGGVLAILGLAVAVFVLLPADLAFNDYVGGAIFGATILLLSAFARFAHPEADAGQPTGSER